MKQPLILCLGNDILSDDGFGPEVARRLARLPAVTESAEIADVALSGFALLDLLAGRGRVLIVDSIVTGASPAGTLHRFEAGELAPCWNLSGSHQINLPTALAFGRRLGYEMPDEVDVIAVEAGDVQTLHEGLGAEVAAAVDEAVQMAAQWVGRKVAKEESLCC